MSNGLRISGLINANKSSAGYRGSRGISEMATCAIGEQPSVATHSRAFLIASNLS